MPALTLENVSLQYRKSKALIDINLTIKENTICGLLGRNGAGKTSLMSLIASYRPASSGRVLYGDEPVFDNPKVMPEVMFVYNRNPASNSMKVREYLTDFAHFRPRWDSDYASRLLSEFDINTKKPISSLSLGQQASVYAISGLASRCPVTLYDEAYLGMDAAVRKRFIQEVLDDYLREPRTIVFSTHFIGEIESMLEDVLVLSEGEVLLYENTDTLRSRGFAIVGEVGTVDRFIAGLPAELLSSRQLGNQKEVVLYGELPEEKKRQALADGLTFSQPSLQDLFVHLTEGAASENHTALKGEAARQENQ